MRPVVRKATVSDAQIVHDMISAIPWISEATKSAAGLTKTQEACARGEIYVVTMNAAIVSLMWLRKDRLAASMGYNIWEIPLVTTVGGERRKGYARTLIRTAKQVAKGGRPYRASRKQNVAGVG